ncbi:MAG: hypothetical protein LCH41_03595 [Armatimonadetes bacterium]|nr:hypothetical protein [Armatimonadota bacterium]
MKIAPLLLLAGVLIAGCQSETATQTDTPNSGASASGNPAKPSGETATQTDTSNSGASASDNTPKPSGDTASGVKPGMSMADVKKIKGAPKDTKHDHGPNGSEIDLWIYADQTVKFQDGKVVD